VTCLFCQIIGNKIPAEKIFEGENVIGIKDISPQAPIHYLFIPKKHFENLEGLDPDSTLVLAEIFSAIQTVARKENFAAKGYRTVINTNKDSCQSVYHLHVHCLAGTQLGGNMSGISGIH
jgi:histidine triad (HIT) family protein